MALSALGLSYLPKTMGGDIVCYSIEHSDEHAEDEEGDPTPYEDQHYEVNGEKFGVSSHVSSYPTPFNNNPRPQKRRRYVQVQPPPHPH